MSPADDITYMQNMHQICLEPTKDKKQYLAYYFFSAYINIYQWAVLKTLAIVQPHMPSLIADTCHITKGRFIILIIAHSPPFVSRVRTDGLIWIALIEDAPPLYVLDS